ncbi:MAG: tRNA lysidine(34) synthetase TilS [Lachnospiraceae bacterium]
MIKKVEAYVEKWQMLEQQDRVIVGVSGGADSVCLLLVLLELQKIWDYQLIVVHVNHGLRAEYASRDEAYVEHMCQKYNVKYISYHIDVESIAKKRKQSIEEAGRDVRRRAFYETLRKEHGTKIALAHHKNDNVETFFMNASRGTGVRGLGGMYPKKNKIIRPLLCVERTEIETYLAEQRIEYCTDETNESDVYTRNKIRHHVIPYLEHQVNPQTISHIEQTMEQLREVQQYLEQQVALCFQVCVDKNLLKKEPFLTVPKALQPLLIHKMVSMQAEQEKDVLAVHIESIQRLLDNQVGRKIDLPYGIYVLRCYEGVRFVKKNETADVRKEPIVHYQIIEYPSKEKEPMEKGYTKWFDYDIIKNSLEIRTRQLGDYITIDKYGNTQKLKSYFINEKIPQEERDHIFLVADGHHIVWIVGYRTNYAYRVSSHTKKVMEIKIEKGDQNERNN